MVSSERAALSSRYGRAIAIKRSLRRRGIAPHIDSLVRELVVLSPIPAFSSVSGERVAPRRYQSEAWVIS